MKKFKKTIAILFGSASVVSCAVGGSPFTDIGIIPSGKGVIYFYRPKDVTGSAITLNVEDNGRKVFTLGNGQYVKYPVSPGKHTFKVDSAYPSSPIELSVNQGENYFVRSGVQTGAFNVRWNFERVYPESAVKDMRECCKSGENLQFEVY